jgi:hypothetical protein
MKKPLIHFLATLGSLAISAGTLGQQTKPRVFISGTGNVDVRTDASATGGRFWAIGSAHSTVGAHDQTMELAKDFGKQCPDVVVTLKGTEADYTVSLNHEAFHGLVHKNDQVMVSNRRGDVVMSNSTRAVSHSVNDSCSVIAADWRANGHIELPKEEEKSEAAVTPSRVMAATITTPAPVGSSSAIITTSEMQVIWVPQTESLGDVAKRYKAQKAAQPQQSAQTQTLTTENR